MEAEIAGRFEVFCSTPRFARYRSATSTDLEAVALYCWNVQLAEALYPAIAALEIALRNGVHDVLTYWQNTDHWFMGVLNPDGREKFKGFHATLTKQLGTEPTSGKIVSELTFGFWTALFTHHYHSLWWEPPTNPPLAWLLPNHPKVTRETRKRVAERLDYIRQLRNRVVHHEAIFDGVLVRNKPKLDLATLHQHILEFLEWLNFDAVIAVACIDRFAQIYDPQHGHLLEIEIRNRFSAISSAQGK